MRRVSPGRSFRVDRVATWLIALAAVILGPAAGRAQTYTWNQPTSGGSWQTSSNWTPSGPPNAVSAVAVFGNVATGAHTVNLSAGVTIGALRFEDVNAGPLTAAYTIASGQTITLNNGTDPSQLTVGGFTRTNQTVAAALSVTGGNGLIITNDGAPGLTTLTLSGALSSTTASTPLNIGGSSNTTISGAIGSNFNLLTKSGTGVLTLSSLTSAYGGTVITGGAIRITDDRNLGQTTGTPNTSAGVTLNGGALWIDADIFVDRNFTLGSNGGTIITTAGTGASNPTIRGTFTGSSTLTFDGGYFVDLTANSSNFTGATVINNAGLRLTGGGRLSSTSSVTVNGYVGGQIGILTLDNSGGSADRVNNSAGITLNGGMIAGVVGLFGGSDESLGTLTLKGYGSLNATQVNGGFGTGSMTFTDITRFDNFSTLYVGGPVYGPSMAGQNYQFKFTNGLTAPGGTNQTIGIVPWIGGDRGKVDGSGFAIAPTNYASTLYTFSATDGLIALDPASGTNFYQVAANATFNGAVPGAKNNAITNNPAAVNSSVTILSLVQNPNSGVSTISGSGTLTVSTGAIANINQMIFDGPTLNFNSATGYLWLGNEFVVMGNSRITGTNGLVVSSNSDDGRNALYLINTANANTFSGGLYLNGTARVAFDTADSQLGAAGEKISFRGGSLRYIGGGSVALATSGTNRPLELSAAGGGIINIEDSNGVLTVPGLVSGTEQLTVLGPGTLVLANTNNTYQGGTTVGDSTLAIAGPNSLGTGGLTLGVKIGTTTYSGGKVRFDSAGTYAFGVNHSTGVATLDTNGNAVTLSGVISGNGTTLTKTGAGTLTLSAANTYSGNTLVGAGRLLITNATGSGTGYGSVTVASGASFGGTSTVNGSLTVNGTGKLIVGLPTGPGTLTLRGTTTLSSTSSFDVSLAGSTAGTGYSQLVITAGGSINLGGTTFTPTLSYVPTTADKLFLIDNRNATGGLTGTFAGLAQGATVTFADGTTAIISYTGDYGTLSVSGGNDAVLHSFVPVPEPGAVLAVASLALAGLGVWKRRRAATVAA